MHYQFQLAFRLYFVKIDLFDYYVFFFAASPINYAKLYTCQMQHFFSTKDSKKTWEFVKGKGLFPFSEGNDRTLMYLNS